MKKLLSAVTSAAMGASLMASAFASSVSAAGSISVSQPNVSMGEVLDVSANKTASDGSVEWLIPTVTAAPGQTVSIPVVAKNSSLAVAGAQFNIDAASPMKYLSVTGGDAYTSTIGDNGKGTKFLFDDGMGIEKVAAEGATVFTLAYTVPTDCAEGTYDIKWANTNVSDTDGFDITKNVKFTDGAIKVVKDSGEGKIDWVLDKVSAYPGETVTLKAYVSNKDNTTLAVAGAQYTIDAESPIKYKSAKSGGAYVNDIGINESKTSFLFKHGAGLGVVAADNATIMTLTYTVPADCKPGEYPVKWSKGFVSDTDGFDLTSRVNFIDGSITVTDAPQNGAVAWVLDNVKGQPGETVKVRAIVDDPNDAKLPVAGAQFNINADTVKYSGFTDGKAYSADMSANEDKNKFMFRTASGKSVAAADGSTILTISYDIPANCPAGVYPVTWADQFVSDTDGYDLTKNVLFKDGSITVGDVDPTNGSVSWVIPVVEGKKGESVTLNVKVDGKGDLPVAGAQFEINGTAPTTYKSATGTPYGEDLRFNDEKQRFEFFTASGNGKTAKSGDDLFSLTFDVPADIEDGVYPVTWANQFVSDTDGFDISKKVTFQNGAIVIGVPVTTTTMTQTTTVTTTTTTVAPSPKDGVAWQIGTVTALPGQTVPLNITVVDTENSKLAIGGAQFNIKNADAIKYSSASGSLAYSSKLDSNDTIQKFMFANSTGKGVSAANGAIVATITFTVPADCPEGRYPVEFVDGSLNVSDTDGYDFTKLVEGRNGWIEVVKPVTTTLAANSSTTTTTVDTTTSTPGGSTTTATPISTTTATPISTTADPGSSTTTATPGSTTTANVTGVTPGSTTTATPGSSTTATPGSTTTADVTGVRPGSSTTTADVTGVTPGSSTTTANVTGVTPGSSTTATPGTTVVSTTLPEVQKGAIAWVVEGGKAYPGEEVTVKVVVNDKKGTNLAISGAEFRVTADGKVQLVKAGDKSAYGADVKMNGDKAKFLFTSGTGLSHVAPDGSTVIELTYKIDADATPGSKIPVTIKDLFISDADGFDLSNNVLVVDGEIEVLTPTTQVVTSEVVTSDVTGVTPGSSTTTADVTGVTPGSSTTTADVTGVTPGSSTTANVTGVTPGSTTATPGESTTSSTTTTINTTQKGVDVSSTTNNGQQGGTEISNSSSTTTTTSTSTTSTTSPISTTSAGYQRSYATIETQVGYYFSHDNGVRANGEKGGFSKDQVLVLKIYDVYEDGYEVERPVVDDELINFNGATPESEYNARTHTPKQTTIEDFKYDVPVYYGTMQLVDKDGKPLTVPAYIGVKGDATLDNMVDSVDASAVLRYYASVSTNDRTVYDVTLQSTKAGLEVSSPKDELDELAAFLADVNTNEWSADNWKTKKDGRRIDSNDASKILAFYARRSSADYNNVSNFDIWNEVLGTARFGA